MQTSSYEVTVILVSYKIENTAMLQKNKIEKSSTKQFH